MAVGMAATHLSYSICIAWLLQHSVGLCVMSNGTVGKLDLVFFGEDKKIKDTSRV